MKEILLPPLLSKFLFSLRDIGYSLETAIADVIDNSISAKAKNVRIFALPSMNTLAILDDGEGMSEAMLKDAMQLGSVKEERSDNDLGRFGLGLKTASFSQCKKLTVLSKKSGIISGFCWDLDLIAERNDWVLKYVDIDECRETLDILNTSIWNAFTSSSSGSIVLWEKIDRYATEDHFNNELDNLVSHLALVFHRYISPGGFKRQHINMFFNKKEIDSFDPFATNNRARQGGNTEIQKLSTGEEIHITPFVLPHYSRLSGSDYKTLATKDGFTKTQGFYLYREGRLLVYGTWFNLACIQDASSLVRIRVDIDNKQDHLWQIDVKKSRAAPIPEVKQILKHYVGTTSESARRVYRHKGKKLDVDGICYWNEHHLEGKVKFCVNREHPVLKELGDALDTDSRMLVYNFLNGLEECLPFDRIHGLFSTDPHIVSKEVNVKEDDMKSMVSFLHKKGKDKDMVKEIMLADECFRERPDMIERVIEEIFNV